VYATLASRHARAYARDQRVLIHPISGTYYDCGNTREWLAANLAAAHAVDADLSQPASEKQ